METDVKRPSFADVTNYQPPSPQRSRKAPKPKAASVAEYVSQALAAPTTQPPPLPPLMPQDPNRRRAGIWTSMTPEERTAHAKHLSSLRDPANMVRPSRKGIARGWSAEAFAVAQASARMEAAELVYRLKAAGLIAPDDHAGAEATLGLALIAPT